MARLVVQPLKAGKRAAGKALKPHEVSRADFAKLVAAAPAGGAAAAPIRQPKVSVVFADVTEEMTGDKHSAYKTLRQERTNAKLQGRRAKKAADAEKEVAPKAEAPAE